jgi:hypothetical protein
MVFRSACVKIPFMAKHLRWANPRWAYPWLFMLLVLLSSDSTFAQSAYSSTITSLQTGDFPQITAYLDVRDDHGGFVPRIQPDQIVVVENGVPQPASEFIQLNSGVLFAAVINPGASLAIRDGQGASRYDRLMASLSEWAIEQEGEALDLSLLINNGPEIYHLTNAEEWMTILLGHQSDFRRAEPSLDVLDRAIDIASGPTLQPGMGRAVLFITPPLEGDYSLGLHTLAARAREQDVRVYVWMVASPDAFASQAAEQLADLAFQTQGYFFAFSGSESIPSLDGYLEPLRSVYQFSYNSKIDKGGTNDLYLEIFSRRVWRDGIFTPQELLVASLPYSFDLDIRPPNPVFISPPTQIERSDGLPNAVDPLELFPQEQSLNILIEFPDRLPRPLVATTLFVNGNPVAQNSTPPFDVFQWNLMGYNESTDLLLRVEAVDNLGLKGASIDTSVQITVARAPRSLLSILSSQVPLVVAVVVVLSGSVLFLVLILGGGIRPKVFGRGARVLNKDSNNDRLSGKRSDPVTQPVMVRDELSTRRLPGWINPLHWPHRTPVKKATAYLNCLSEKDRKVMLAPLPLSSGDLSLGRDPHQCGMVLDDVSIDALHAQLQREGDSYRILDMGSTAGTWVNFSPVSREGILLEHGDLVHIGRIGFRFTLRSSAATAKPVVTPQEPSE